MELYVGNNENYDDVHPRVYPYLITKDRELYRFSKMGEMPFVHEEMRKAVNFIVGHPRVEVRLTAERAVSFWMGTPTPLRDFYRADTFLLQMVSVCNLLAVLGTLGGIAVLYRQRSEFTFPLAVSPVVFPLLYYATHASLRYRHPLDPIIVILATIAAAAPLGTLGNRRQPALGPAQNPSAKVNLPREPARGPRFSRFHSRGANVYIQVWALLGTHRMAWSVCTPPRDKHTWVRGPSRP
jgi:hypothetical protein